MEEKPLWIVLNEAQEHGDFKHGDTVWTLAWDDGPHYWLEPFVADCWQTIRTTTPEQTTSSHWVLKGTLECQGCLWREESLMGHTKEEALEKALQYIKEDILENTEDYLEGN
jgi:hypothetical protein